MAKKKKKKNISMVQKKGSGNRLCPRFPKQESKKRRKRGPKQPPIAKPKQPQIHQ